jgi:hypothetical protein
MEERDVWREVCYQARVEHERQMALLVKGEGPLASGRAKQVQVLLFRPGVCESLGVSAGSWVELVEYSIREARRREGVAVGAVMAGVASEEEKGKVHLRPALLTIVMGLGACEHLRFEISHRYEDEGHAVVFYGPLSRNGSGDDPNLPWTIEWGMEGALVGPWPMRLARETTSGGGALTL